MNILIRIVLVLAGALTFIFGGDEDKEIKVLSEYDIWLIIEKQLKDNNLYNLKYRLDKIDLGNLEKENITKINLYKELKGYKYHETNLYYNGDFSIIFFNETNEFGNYNVIEALSLDGNFQTKYNELIALKNKLKCKKKVNKWVKN